MGSFFDILNKGIEDPPIKKAEPLQMRPNDIQYPAYKFDPEGSGYDSVTADRLKIENPLLVKKPTSYVGDFYNPDDSFESWVWHADIKDYKIHGASRNP